MGAFLRRAIAPRGLGLAFTLAVIPFCCRVDNTFMWMLDSQGIMFPFMFALCGGAMIGCLFTALTPLESPSRQALWTVAGSASFLFGIVAAGLVQVIVPMASGLVAGVLMGIGLSMMLRQWWVIYAPLRTDTMLCTAAVALLLTSIIWYALRFTSDFSTTCLCLAMCVLCAALLCLLFLAVDIRRDRADAPEPADGAPAALEPTADPEPAAPFPLWVAAFAAAGLWFNFFTLGLTFYPDAAGLGTDAITVKPLPYALVAAVVLGAVSWISGRKGEYTTFLTVALACAGAIVLATPFINGAIQTLPLVEAVSYVGVALFNVLGFALPLRVLKRSEQEFTRGVAALVAGSVLALVAGVFVFRAVGENGQLVSLCLLSAYLVALVAASISCSLRTARRAEAAAAADGRDADVTGADAEAADVAADVAEAPEELPDRRVVACEALSERYQLSPRESEVLGLLSRGYGTRYIAERLFISADTVRTHCKRIYDKADVHTREELIELLESYE